MQKPNTPTQVKDGDNMLNTCRSQTGWNQKVMTKIPKTPCYITNQWEIP